MKVDWCVWTLPGGTAFVACFFGCYGFAYDYAWKAGERLREAMTYA